MTFTCQIQISRYQSTRFPRWPLITGKSKQGERPSVLMFPGTQVNRSRAAITCCLGRVSPSFPGTLIARLIHGNHLVFSGRSMILLWRHRLSWHRSSGRIFSTRSGLSNFPSGSGVQPLLCPVFNHPVATYAGGCLQSFSPVRPMQRDVCRFCPATLAILSTSALSIQYPHTYLALHCPRHFQCCMSRWPQCGLHTQLAIIHFHRCAVAVACESTRGGAPASLAAGAP